ncbi:hypothetical protein [Mucilaginibacter sp. UYCu711]|uniref:hypothetical protein n=1 Tax=Mucilaginibacter sp. UYCu711 TaxID=3156339 RepID=UPI003D24D6FF
MQLVICTLFEGGYHYGVAALTNSLISHGYQGSVYAGYRGEIPVWAKSAVSDPNLFWPGSKTLRCSEKVVIHFLPLETRYHFTNYKPDFMIELLDGPAKGAKGIFYFDPDIVLSYNWSFFQEWISYGVAVCEDINSPLAMNHPRRLAWRAFFKGKSVNLNFKEPYYANGGFIGVKAENRDFLIKWKTIQEIMAPLFGGLSKSTIIEKGSMIESLEDDYSAFSKTDQDALNISIEAYNGHVSFIGKEAMAFKSGATLIPHALGINKPWNSNIFSQLIVGHTPRLVDKEYWEFAKKGPIKFHSSALVWRKIISIKIASLVGRFYSRG